MYEGARQERPGARQFFDSGDSRVDVLAKTAMFFGDGETAQPHIRKLAKQIARPVVHPVPHTTFFARRFFHDEAPELTAQRADVIRFGKRRLDHHSPVSFGARFSTNAATASFRSASVLDKSS